MRYLFLRILALTEQKENDNIYQISYTDANGPKRYVGGWNIIFEKKKLVKVDRTTKMLLLLH